MWSKRFFSWENTSILTKSNAIFTLAILVISFQTRTRVKLYSVEWWLIDSRALIWKQQQTTTLCLSSDWLHLLFLDYNLSTLATVAVDVLDENSRRSPVNQTRFRLSCACAVLIYLFESSNAKDDWYEDIEYMQYELETCVICSTKKICFTLEKMMKRNALFSWKGAHLRHI